MLMKPRLGMKNSKKVWGRNSLMNFGKDLKEFGKIPTFMQLCIETLDESLSTDFHSPFIIELRMIR